MDMVTITRAQYDAALRDAEVRTLREAAERYSKFTRPGSGLIPKDWADGFMEALDGVAKDLGKRADEVAQS